MLQRQCRTQSVRRRDGAAAPEAALALPHQHEAGRSIRMPRRHIAQYRHAVARDRLDGSAVHPGRSSVLRIHGLLRLLPRSYHWPSSVALREPPLHQGQHRHPGWADLPRRARQQDSLLHPRGREDLGNADRSGYRLEPHPGRRHPLHRRRGQFTLRPGPPDGDDRLALRPHCRKLRVFAVLRRGRCHHRLQRRHALLRRPANTRGRLVAAHRRRR